MNGFIEVQGYPGYYINNKGKVISTKNNTVRELKSYKDTNGYLNIRLINSNGKRTHSLVHRLVAIAFIHNPEDKPEVNHIDGNKTNNEASNLEWVSRSENLIHSYNELGHTPVRNFKGCKLYRMGSLIGTFGSVKEACKYASVNYNISFTSLEKYRKTKDFTLIVE